jgi:cytochrome c peroxidase
MVVVPDGSALVWCAFTRTVLRVDALDRYGLRAEDPSLHEGPVVTASSLTADEHRGLVLFNATVPEINVDGALACATCHLDGRADGLTWKIGIHAMQTPVLGGRLSDTSPYKWAGTDETLEQSLATTVARLRGAGLGPGQPEALIAYLARLERPRPPTLDRAAIARGKAVFEGEAGCSECHGGDAYTDGSLHRLYPTTLDQADTPSLVGLAASAPYVHDGSAPTLADVVRGRGNIGMADTSHLDEAQLDDLAVYLASL